MSDFPPPPIPRSAPKRRGPAKHRQPEQEHGQVCETCGGRALLVTKGDADGLLVIQCQRDACGAELPMVTGNDVVKQAQKALRDYLDAKRRNPKGWEDLQLKGAAREAYRKRCFAEMDDALDRLCKILHVKG